MKTTRMVVGIISMVLFLIVSLQSCVAGLGNTLADNGEVSGSAGFMLALCMLIAGIIAVAARKTKGGTITALCFYAVGGLIGIANVGTYSDLKVWSVIAFVFAAIMLITLLIKDKTNKTDNTQSLNN